jgi:pimeloyl-ACP methyl ester carboxylesterase
MRVDEWQAARTLDGNAVRREVRYVRSGANDVFVSTYTSTEPRRDFALLVCPGWGHEAGRLAAVQHGLAAGMGNLGGVGVAFDYPGQGDSGGDPTTATLADMTQAALDVATEIATSFTGRLVLSGLRLGGAVAVLASSALHPAVMALVWPELDPETYFADSLRRSKRANLGDPESEGMAFGVPVSAAVLDSVRGAASAVESALEAAACPVGVVPTTAGDPFKRAGGRMSEIRAPDRPSGRPGNYVQSVEAVLGWLDPHTEGA